MVTIACSYSLLSRQPEEQTLSLHRLVQAILLDAMTEGEWELWTRRAIGALDMAFPEILPTTEYNTWKQCERLLPHALLCLYRARTTEESLTLASLAYKTAQYLRACGRFTEAEPLYQRALHIREQVLGPDHPEVAFPLNYLAIVYYFQGKYAEAEPLYQRALHIREQALGPDHPEVARPLNYLAFLYVGQGKYAEAELLYQRALRIREQSLGPDHPKVADSLNGLANLYTKQRKYTRAEPVYQRALRIREQHLGQQHPETAQILHDLAVFWHKQGRLDEALNLAERALSIRSQSQGDAHPKTIASRTLLAQLLQEQTPTAPSPEIDPQTIPTAQEKLPVPTINVAVRGATKQVAYTRAVRMREVTFTCSICGQTITQ